MKKENYRFNWMTLFCLASTSVSRYLKMRIYDLNFLCTKAFIYSRTRKTNIPNTSGKSIVTIRILYAELRGLVQRCYLNENDMNGYPFMVITFCKG